MLEDKILQDTPVDERRQILLDSADEIVKSHRYVKDFTHEELERFKSSIPQILMDIDEIEEAKKAAMDGFKQDLEPLKDELKELVHNVKYGSHEVKEDCFKMFDHETGRVGYYNSEGELILSRPATPDEKQTTIHVAFRQAANDR